MRYPCRECETKSEGCFNACPEYKLYQLFLDIDRCGDIQIEDLEHIPHARGARESECGKHED